MGNKIDKYKIIVFSIVNNPYPCLSNMVITENYSNSYVVLDFCPKISCWKQHFRKISWYATVLYCKMNNICAIIFFVLVNESIGNDSIANDDQDDFTGMVLVTLFICIVILNQFDCIWFYKVNTFNSTV